MIIDNHCHLESENPVEKMIQVISWRHAVNYPNVYLDISGSYLSAPLVKKAV